jgi:hypothetical protein
MNKRYLVVIACLGFVTIFNQLSCSKSSPDPTPPSSDPCAGKNILITATPTAATGCGGTGSLTVSATGSTGFTYKLNGGSYQASGSFTAVAAGNHTVYAKDAAGCEKSQAVTVTSTGTLGVKFTAVKNLLAAKCQTCHNPANMQGGMNWTVDCNIVQFSARIKVRAVDIGDMPFGGPMLTTGEKAIITDWINAGGQLSN